MGERREVPVYCYQCVAGPDLLKVEVEDGVATRIASNFDIREEHPGGGRVCVKAYGLIQKTYNPDRVRQPMKRTNPRKGRDEDPGFVPIDWEEAYEIIADRLLRYESELERVVVRVHKPHAPLPGVLRDVFVEVTRGRSAG